MNRDLPAKKICTPVNNDVNRGIVRKDDPRAYRRARIASRKAKASYLSGREPAEEKKKCGRSAPEKKQFTWFESWTS